MKLFRSSRLTACLTAIALAMTGVLTASAQSEANVIGTPTATVIMGKVVDDEGEPLPGASVRIKGGKATTDMTMTNENGIFGLKYQRQGNAVPTLQVSYIGMERVETKAVFDKQMRIVLKPDATRLNEVTVIDDGYNRLPRRDMVGAYTTLKAEDVIIPGYQSIDQMLQGRVAGMIVQNTSSRVGASAKINIRGTSTILGNTDPLWVVDGVIQPDPLEINMTDALTEDLSEIIGNQISWLNPMDIETITVLKDAAATAIYGSKASNGVIVITTKKGSSDRFSIRYQGNISIRERATYDNYNYMNSLERITFSKEAYEAGARYATEPLHQPYTYEGLMAMFNSREITEAQFEQSMRRLETVNTDWLKLLTRNSVSNNHTISISGGGNKVTYNASFGYQSNKGTEIGNQNEQFTSRLNVHVNISPRLQASINMASSWRNSDGYAGGVNPQTYALTTSRAIPVVDENGNRVFYNQSYNYRYNTALLEYGYNILNELDNTYSSNNSRNFQVSLNLDYKILDWLTFQLNGAVVQASNNSEAYAGEKSSYIETRYRGYPAGSVDSSDPLFKAAMLPFGGQYKTVNSSSDSYSAVAKFQISKTFAEKHRINSLLGMEIRSVKGRGNTNTVWGYVPERGELLIQPNRPGEITPVGSTQTIYWGVLDNLFSGGWSNYHRTDNYISYFATLAYSFDNRYVVNANIRQDASNRFGQDTRHKFNPTYSFGFSWRLAQEHFIKENCWWLNEFSLNATYGIQGNVVNSVSPDLLAAYQGIMNGYNQYYVTISSLPNPLLKWESTRSWNLGLNATLLNKFFLNFSYYGRRSNAVISQIIPQEYGINGDKMKLNGGIIYNHGVEFSFNYTPIHTKDVTWTVGFNTSKNWNKTNNNYDTRTDATGDAKVIYNNYFNGNAGQPVKAGYPLYGFWSYSFAGLDPANGYPNFNNIEFEKADNTMDPTDFLVFSGSLQPYFTGGFNTRIRYKDFSIGTSFSALLGSKKRLSNPYSNFTNGKIPDPYYNLQKTLNDRWKKPGDELHTIIPALYTSGDPIKEPLTLKLPNGLENVNRYDMWALSDAMVASGNFLRCNMINASYSLPSHLLSKFGAQSLQFTATMSNVFFIASKRWNGFDPELGNGTHPHVYTVGINLGF